jgi:hypothetical protein
MYVYMPFHGWQKVTVIGRDRQRASANYGKYLVKNEGGAAFFVSDLDLHDHPEEKA